MRNSIQSITYILGGSLVYTSSSFSGGWGAGLLALFGFAIFIKGLSMLKGSLDDIGRIGVSYMRTGAILGGCAAIIDLVPFMFVITVPCFIAAFALQLYGLLQFRESANLNTDGKQGAQKIINAMILSIIASIISAVPFLGDFVASLIAIGAIYFSFTGWLKVQDGLDLAEVGSYAEADLV